MGLFSRKRDKEEPRPAAIDMPSLFMNDDSEGDFGKEAMLDYQLSYLLRLADSNNHGTGEEISRRTIMKLLEKKVQLDQWGDVDYLVFNNISVKVWKQWQHIDLIVEVEANFVNGKEKHIIVVENKAYTGLHDDQLNRYSQIVEDWYKGQNVQIHYWVITFFDNDTKEFDSLANQCKEARGDWKCLSFYEVVDLTDKERLNGTYNEILDEFWVKSWY